MNITKSALHNLSKQETVENMAYTYGLVVGVVSTLMQERSCSFDGAIKIVKGLLPNDFDLERITPAWQVYFS